jgi:hypothetical protein
VPGRLARMRLWRRRHNEKSNLAINFENHLHYLLTMRVVPARREFPLLSLNLYPNLGSLTMVILI